MNPKDFLALAFTADYYAMTEQEQPAREHIARALEIAPGDAKSYFAPQSSTITSDVKTKHWTF